MTKVRNRDPRSKWGAADWFAHLNEPDTEIEVDDLELFSAWRKTPENRAAYERLEDIGRALRDMQGDPELEAVAAEALARGDARRAKARQSSGRPRYIIGAVLAAACVLGAVGAALRTQMPTHSTKIGETFSATLADGSRVELNTDSAIKVRFHGHERQVVLLKGQALFDVAHDAARPFIVVAGETRVRALGTRFEVRKVGDDVRVVLAQGSVEVTDRAVRPAPWRLSPGQALALAPKAPASTTAKSVDVPAAISWTSGKITFQDMPLGEAVAEVNRYSRQKIVLGPGVPVERRVSGVFPAGDNGDFVAAMGAVFHLDAATGARGEIIMQPKSDNAG